MLSCSGAKKFQADQGYQQKAWAYHPGPQQIDSQGAAWAGLFESRCAQQGRRRRERLDHRSKEKTRLGRTHHRIPVPRYRQLFQMGAALNVAVGRVPSVCSRVLENGTNCGGRTKPSYLAANGASVVCPRRERQRHEEARSSRNDHPED